MADKSLVKAAQMSVELLHDEHFFLTVQLHPITLPDLYLRKPDNFDSKVRNGSELLNA